MLFPPIYKDAATPHLVWPGRAFGRNLTRPEPRAVLMHAGTNLTGLGPPPDNCDWQAAVASSSVGVQMLGNDVQGNCAWAAFVHACQQFSIYAGKPVTPTDDDALLPYAGCTGADLTNPPGPGTYIMGPGGAVEFLAKNGLMVGGEKFVFRGFPTCQPSDITTIRQMIHIFGGVAIGFDLCDAAETDGFVWSTMSPTIVGGHEVWINKYIMTGDDGRGHQTFMFEFDSWGDRYRCDDAYLQAYAREAVSLFSPQSIDDRGIDGSGVPIADLDASLKLFQEAA